VAPVMISISISFHHRQTVGRACSTPAVRPP
jgi:hypothetical protein